MSFLQSIISWLRNIRSSVFTGTMGKSYNIGSIISGQYSNYKHDYSPTILYLGTYQAKNGKYYIHGLQLHYMNDSEINWLLKLIYMMKRGGQVIVPRQFYYYIKMYQPGMVKRCYRIYHAEMANFYTISPGFSNMSVKACYSVRDTRDYRVTQLNQMIDQSYNASANNYTKPSRVAYNQDELKEHIQMVLNTRKII